MHRWSACESTAPRQERVHDEPEDGRHVELLPRHVDRSADHLRDRSLLHVPLRRQVRNAALRIARRRDDGCLVDDPVRVGRDDPVAALAGDARARRRRTAVARARLPAVLARERVHRHVRDGGHARVGPARLRRAAALRASLALRALAARDRDRSRADGARARVDVHPLPLRERALEPAGVPGLDRVGPCVLDVAAPRVDAPDLVGAPAVLGHRCDQARGTRRRGVGAARHGRPAGCRIPRAFDAHVPLVRDGRTQPRNAFADMRHWLSVFFVGGAIAYRGLFNWIRPAMYIPTMLGSPLFQLIFFTKLGQYAHAEARDFYIVGNSVQVCAMSSVYGMTMAVANERWFGTLGPLLASPANRAAVFLGRGVPVLANGLLVSTFTFLVGVLLLGFRPGLDAVPALALVVLVTVTSCTAFGMLLGSIGLRAKDFFFAANLAYFLMLLFCGVNIPLSVLPGWMNAV